MKKKLNLNDRKKILYFHIIIFIIAFICETIVILNSDMLFWGSSYNYNYVAEMRYGKSHTLVTDNGKETLFVVDEKGRLLRRYDGGSDSAPFYYICHLAETDDGSIYLSDISYGKHGNRLEYERIIRLKGTKKEVIYSFDYGAGEDAPLQYGNILELQEYDGEIYFLYSDDNNLTIYKVEGTGKISAEDTVCVSSSVMDASYDFSSDTFVITYRNGDLEVRYPDGQNYYKKAGESRILWDVCARGGAVYYTELLSTTLNFFDEESPEDERVFFENGNILYKLDVSKDGKSVMTTDYGGYYCLYASDEGEGILEDYVTGGECAYFYKTVVLWLMAVIGVICVILLFIRIGIDILKLIIKSEQVMRVSFIIVSAIAVGFLMAYSLLGEMSDDKKSSTEMQTRLFAEILLGKTDVETLLEINETTDYESEAFYSLKAPLDELVKESYEEEEYYYYVIYRQKDGMISLVADYEESVPCYMPAYSYEDEPYYSVFENGEIVSYMEESALGGWTFVLLPIKDRAGNIVGALEVGLGLDKIVSETNELMKNMILSSGTCAVVVAVLLLEFAFLLGFFEKRQRISVELRDATDTNPLRTYMFITYAVDSMQDVFIALLCNELYKGGLPLSRGVAVALPMSMQLFVMAFISAFVGKIISKNGTKRTINFGFLIQIVGCIVCALAGNYSGILFGKIFMGCGMGIIYVCCNTIAALGENEEKSADAFAAVSAGTLSGFTIGAGLSAVLFSLGGWRIIYIAGALILMLGLFISLFGGDAKPKTTAKKEENSSENIAGFLLDRRVILFFVFILLPFMISLSYREYVFPLVGAESGIGEVQIGRIYLLCGIVSLYMGPYISSWMLKKFGGFKSICIASLLLSVGIAAYFIYPHYLSAVAGVVILALASSFAFACQYTYFENLPVVSRYGEGNSMGVYSIVESIGQTLGPIAYGMFLGFGFRIGIGIAFAMVMLFAVIFTVSGIKGGESWNDRI